MGRYSVSSIFSPNAGKYEPEKLRIRTLFRQWQPKRYFLTASDSVIDKTMIWNYFLNCFSHKVRQKRFLGATFVLCKRFIKTKLSFQYIILSKAGLWNEAFCQKKVKSFCQKKSFLHENAISIGSFTMESFRKLRDFTVMITYFLTKPNKKMY